MAKNSLLTRKKLFFQKVNLKAILVLFFFIFLLNFSLAQEEAPLLSKYFKKTIAYYDNAVLIGKGILKKPSDENRRYLSYLISKQINIPRFYWESLPEQTVLKFNEVSSKTYSSLDEVNSDVENYLAPELVKILDINKEIRALSLVSEAERNSFIATKAKSLGISADKVERVMNSGYVVVPFIEKYVVSRDTIVKKVKTKDREYKIKVPGIKVLMQGGMAFFKVNFKNNVYSVEPVYAVVQNKDVASFVEVKDNNVTAAEDSAFKLCSVALVNNFELTIKNLFKLSAPVTEAGFNSISFPLGRREGIRMDEGFDVFEFVQDVKGDVKTKRVGFVRINSVWDNSSSAQIIIGGIFSNRIERGMFVEERPRLPGDILLGGLLSTVKIQTGAFKLNEGRVSNDTLDIKSVGNAVIFKFNINANLSTTSDLKVPQLWMTLGGGIGVIPLEASFFGEKVESATFASFNIGLMKKFYFRRLALNLESGVSISNFKFSIGKKNNSDMVEYALSPRNWLWGGFAGAGIEIVINPDINIGGKVFYQLSQKTNEWSYLRKVGDKGERRKLNLGSVDFTGLMYQVYINISIKNFAKVRKLK